MKIIVGLGNLGTEYVGTRHNAGVMLVDKLAGLTVEQFHGSYGWRRKKSVYVAEFPELVLVKTAGGFMNESGKMIYDLRYSGFFNTPPESPPKLGGEQKGGYESLYIAHDDLDIKLGEYKIQFGVGPKVHYGVQSVEQALGTKEFWRIRIGIDNRSFPEDGEKYVLQRFTKEEREVVDGVFDKIITDL